MNDESIDVKNRANEIRDYSLHMSRIYSKETQLAHGLCNVANVEDD